MDSGSFSTGEHVCTGGSPEPQELKWQRKTTLDICSRLPCESPLLVSLSFTRHGCEGEARGGICWFWLTVVAVLLAVLSKRWLWSSQGMVTILVTFCGLLIYFPSCGISRVLHFLEKGSNPVKKQQHWLCATFMALLCATLFCINIRESTEQFPAVRSLSHMWQIAFMRRWLFSRFILSQGWKLQQHFKLDPPAI